MDYKNYKLVILLFVGTLIFSSCKNDDPVPNDIPSDLTYTGDISNYNEAALKLEMVEEIVDEAKAGNEMGVFVDSISLRKKFFNQESSFSNNDLNGANFNLATSIEPSTRGYFLDLFKDVSLASTSDSPGAKDKAGVIGALDAPSKKKLYNAQGFAPYELIEKGMMGALQIYQTCTYLSDDKIKEVADKDERLKNWDIAFSYLGLPNDYAYSYVSADLSFWGEYMPINNEALGNPINNIFAAFILGRQALETGDVSTAMKKAAIIKTNLELVNAGMALSYLNKGKKYIANSDFGRRNGALSEGVGFIKVLQFNNGRKITDTQINSLLELVGDNNWNSSSSDIESAISTLSGIYGFDTSKF